MKGFSEEVDWQDLYRTIFETTGTATVIIEEDTTISLANKGFVEMCGYAKQELEGRMKWTEFVASADKEKVCHYHKLRRENANAAPRSYEFRLLDRYGNIKHILINVALIPGTEKSVASFLDITEQKRMEKALKESERLRADIISFLPDPTFVIDKEGRVIAWNRAIEELTDIKAKDMLGKGDYEYAVPLYGQRRPILIDQVFKSRKDTEAEDYFFIQNDQEAIIAEHHAPCLRDQGALLWGKATPFYDAQGEILGAIESIRDITERKKTEEQLRLKAEVFERMTEGIIVADIRGFIQAVNVSFTRITGYNLEDIRGSSFRLLDCWNFTDQVMGGVLKSLKETGQWQGEVWTYRKNKERFPAWISISHITDEKGEVAQYVCILFDIAVEVKLREERRQLQEQAARTQRLASLSAMSAGIVHEIAQPLNAIRVLSDGILYWYRKNNFLDVEEALEGFQNISAQASRIEDIIKHMRVFANIGRIGSAVPCNINEAVNGALDLLGRQLASHGILVRKVLASDLPEIKSNQNRLEEMLINLLVNAMQALDLVDQSHKEITCITRRENESVILEVSDNGPGIPEEVKDRIFEPFLSTKEVGKGMGLGLSIVHSVVNSYQGKVAAFNNQVGGATFRIEFPVDIE